MRVISGKLKGRNINGYDILGTRPTMDRVKESIFGMIQSYVNDSVVLDLFSGTGNLGIEAISNGASIVYFNDKNNKCTKIIKDNLSNFNVLENSVITNMDYKDALNYYKNNKIKFDIVFLDPPYKERIINEILYALLEKDLLNDKAIVICELLTKEVFINDKLKLSKDKKYGDKFVLLYKYGN